MTIVRHALQRRDLDIEIVVPVEDMTEPGEPDPLDPDRPPPGRCGQPIYPRLLEADQRHTSTIVFANSRRLAERICSEINNLAGDGGGSGPPRLGRP